MMLPALLLLLATPSPQDQAERAARATPHAVRAWKTLQAEVAKLRDRKLREAVERQLHSPGLPPAAHAVQHPAEAADALHRAGLLEGALPPLTGPGTFAAAPGGPCPDGHHAYPGGLPVHTLANLRHALLLSQTYREVYGVQLDEDRVRAAPLWHDTGKALTLAWKEGGDCGHEPQIAKTPAHHIVGLAGAILHKLPAPLIVTIAAAHAPPTKDNLDSICSWLKAASILATGKPDAVACPSAERPAPLEAFVHNSSDSDYALTGAASLAATAGQGWERFGKLSKSTELQILQSPR